MTLRSDHIRDTSVARLFPGAACALLAAVFCAASIGVWAQGKDAPAATVAPPSKGSAKTISEDEAKKIALKAVPGKVTEVQIEKVQGENRYVIEVQPAKGGKEVDVVIHMVTGKVLAIEK